MSLLVIVWYISLAVLVGIGYVALRRLPNGADETVPLHVNDLAIREIHLVRRDVTHLLRDMRPHALRVIRNFFALLKKGQDFLVTRAYGKIKIHKGSASSFFLKQIAEHQEKEGERNRSGGG